MRSHAGAWERSHYLLNTQQALRTLRYLSDLPGSKLSYNLFKSTG